ncbi:N-methylhydantoinase B/oxoprolinase/acetone carboxylase alpha subunit [Bradyrhizobium liaoningense]
MKLDPFVVEVIRHGLSAAAEEMSLVMTRSARSPLLREAGDLSSAITDGHGGLVGQGRDIPIHLGAMAYTIPELLKVVPRDSLNDGDVLIYNVGALGGNHLNDVKVVRPVFVDGDIVAFAVSLAHWPDIGGTWPGSYFAKAIDTFQEAMRIPPVLIATAAGVNAAIVQLLKANVRDSESCEGDLLAQIAATKAGERRIVELCREHGKAVFMAAQSRLHDLSEIEMRAALRDLPDGVYEGEDYLDDGSDNNAPARIHVKITIRGDEATFDLSGSCDRVSNFCNTTPFMARSAVVYAARIMSGRDMQQNAGALRPLTIITRPGSILEPGWSASVAAGNPRDLHAHRRCDLSRHAGHHPRTPVGRRGDHRGCAVLCRAAAERIVEDALRSSRRRRRRAPRSGRHVGNPGASVQHLEYAGRGDRSELRDPAGAAGDPPTIRRRGRAARW